MSNVVIAPDLANSHRESQQRSIRAWGLMNLLLREV